MLLAVLTSWMELAKRAVVALERIAAALEVHAPAEPIEPENDLEVIAGGR